MVVLPLVLTTPASAGDYDDVCGVSTPAAIYENDTCIVYLTVVGENTFTAPEALETVSVILVGGGGGAYASEDESNPAAFGGGAGEVLTFSGVDSTSTITATVGDRGYADEESDLNLRNGQETSIPGYTAARGGKVATAAGGGASGNGNAGHNVSPGGGGGAGGASTSGDGGQGFDFASLGAPFNAVQDLLAPGGDAIADGDPDDLKTGFWGEGGAASENDGKESPTRGAVIFLWSPNDLDNADDESNGESDSDSETGLPETGAPVGIVFLILGLAATGVGAKVLRLRVSETK